MPYMSSSQVNSFQRQLGRGSRHSDTVLLVTDATNCWSGKDQMKGFLRIAWYFLHFSKNIKLYCLGDKMRLTEVYWDQNKERWKRVTENGKPKWNLKFLSWWEHWHPSLSIWAWEARALAEPSTAIYESPHSHLRQSHSSVWLHATLSKQHTLDKREIYIEMFRAGPLYITTRHLS